MMSYIHRLIVLLFTMLCYGFTAQAQIQILECTKPDSNVLFKSKWGDGVIFNSNSKISAKDTDISGNIWAHVDIKEYASGFKISGKEIEEISTNLKAMMDTKDTFIYNHYADYFKQYFGYINPNKDKLIFIGCGNLEGFLEEEKKDFLVISDAGNAYFYAKYNLTQHKFISVIIPDLYFTPPPDFILWLDK